MTTGWDKHADKMSMRKTCARPVHCLQFCNHCFSNLLLHVLFSHLFCIVPFLMFSFSFVQVSISCHFVGKHTRLRKKKRHTQGFCIAFLAEVFFAIPSLGYFHTRVFGFPKVSPDRIFVWENFTLDAQETFDTHVSPCLSSNKRKAGAASTRHIPSTRSLHSDLLPLAAIASSLYRKNSFFSTSTVSKPATLCPAFFTPMHLDTVFFFLNSRHRITCLR